jgi:hypothetical protein
MRQAVGLAWRLVVRQPDRRRAEALGYRYEGRLRGLACKTMHRSFAWVPH